MYHMHDTPYLGGRMDVLHDRCSACDGMGMHMGAWMDVIIGLA